VAEPSGVPKTRHLPPQSLVRLFRASSAEVPSSFRYPLIRGLYTEAMENRQPSARLDNKLVVERSYTPDRTGMLAALRAVLGLPKAPPQWLQELRR